jgi:beta-lactam-binding protein with PASTA domain
MISTTKLRRYALSVGSVLSVGFLTATAHAQLSGNTISVVERAMNDELTRAKSELHLKGLIDPFFIAYTVADR